jgi:hypothetical protein
MGCCKEGSYGWRRASREDGSLELVSQELAKKGNKGEAGPRLCCAALLDVALVRDGSGASYRACLMEANENVICRILQTGVRLMQLAGRLGGQLAQLIPVRYVGKRPKNQI